MDIYGALSEYIGLCVSADAVTLLDINNTVPAYIYDKDIKGKYDYKLTDTFMGFHCGNTPECKLCSNRAVKYQLIQHRLLEPAGSEPDFTRGTLEADIAASDITFYRLQCDSEGVLRSYIAEGECWMCPPSPLAASAFSPSRRWDASTAMCWWASGTRTTARWPSSMWARRCLRCSSSWA